MSESVFAAVAALFWLVPPLFFFAMMGLCFLGMFTRRWSCGWGTETGRREADDEVARLRQELKSLREQLEQRR